MSLILWITKARILLLLCLFTITSCSTAPVWIKGEPKHHTTKGFRNYPPMPSEAPKGFLFNIRRIWDSFFLPEVPSGHYLSEDEALVRLANLKTRNTITWLGHATFLVKLGGKTILTDPFLSDVASPSLKGGPRRFVPPGLSIGKLPPIDVIIVSHNHYDHLDKETIQLLPNKEAINVFVPLGLRKFFVELGYESICELDWGESSAISGIEIVALPAVHYSGRGFNDKNKTLWCSWGILSPYGNYFFCGDSASSPILFRNIGKEYGSFNLAILPIGAYEPRELLWMSHVNPEEAVGIGLDINATVLVASHWGTIKLSDEPVWEPAKRFIEAARIAGIKEDNIWIMKIGETRILP